MTAPQEKRCFKCGETKPLSDFYKHPQMADGHVNKCKDCNKNDVRENRNLRKEYYDAYDRIRNTEPNRRQQKKIRESRPEVRERIKGYKKTYVYSDKQKSANTLVNNAIRDERLTKQPCFICGSMEVEGHHPYYDRPLDVIWLCTRHHAEIHRDYDHEDDKLLLSITKKGNRWDNK